MRHILVYSQHARTSGNIKDLAKAGRIDILLHSMLHAFFTSNARRVDVTLHLILDGPPTPPRHVQIDGREHISWSKKDLLKLLQIALYKAKPGVRVTPMPGLMVEAVGFQHVVTRLAGAMRAFLLDPRGESFETLLPAEEEDVLLILGDHDGIPSKLWRRVKEHVTRARLGDVMYYTSQSIIIAQYLMDRQWGARLVTMRES